MSETQEVYAAGVVPVLFREHIEALRDEAEAKAEEAEAVSDYDEVALHTGKSIAYERVLELLDERDKTRQAA